MNTRVRVWLCNKSTGYLLWLWLMPVHSGLSPVSSTSLAGCNSLALTRVLLTQLCYRTITNLQCLEAPTKNYHWDSLNINQTFEFICYKKNCNISVMFLQCIVNRLKSFYSILAQISTKSLSNSTSKLTSNIKFGFGVTLKSNFTFLLQ